MFNFTGLTTKKRTVNLGTARKSMAKTQLLEQTRMEREKRERLRLEASATVHLQRRIRRYRAVTRTQKDLFAAVPGPPQHAIRVAAFTWRYAQRRGLLTPRCVQSLCQLLQSIDTGLPTPKSLSNLLNCVMECLSPAQSTASLLVELISVLYQRWSLILAFGGLIPLLARLPPEPPIASLMVAVGLDGEWSDFATHLCSPIAVCQTPQSVDISTLSDRITNRPWKPTGQSACVIFLANYLELVQRGSAFFDPPQPCPEEEQVIRALTLLSALINPLPSIHPETEQEESRLGTTGHAHALLQILSSRALITRVSGFVQRGTPHRALGASLISRLVTMLPRHSEELFTRMVLDADVDYFELLCLSVVTDPTHFFSLFWNSPEPFFRLRQTPLEEIFFDHLDFWCRTAVFLEYYQYYLVVLSVKGTGKSPFALTFMEEPAFPLFLKQLCLTLLFNESGLKARAQTGIFGVLTRNALSLFRVLHDRHLKQDRPHESAHTALWEVDLTSFSVPQLLPFLVSQEDERFRADRDDSSDEAMSDGEVPEVHVSDEQGGTLRVAASSTPLRAHPQESVFHFTLLQQLPFLIPFKKRVEIFQTLVALDVSRTERLTHFSRNEWGQWLRHPAKIRRQFLIEDAYTAFGKLGLALKLPLAIQFFNSVDGDAAEAGADGGGLTKEFLTSVISAASDPLGGYFKETVTRGWLYPNPAIYHRLRTGLTVTEQKQKLDVLRFLGNVIGKCFYSAVLVDITFAPFFMAQWRTAWGSGRSTFTELQDLDPELHLNLVKLLQFSSSEMAALDLTFTVDELVDGEIVTFDLIPRGSTVMVDTHNRLLYLQAVADFKLNRSVGMQTSSFVAGLHEMIPPLWLNMFNAVELQLLLSGGEKDINVADLKHNVVYGGYDLDIDVTINDFWDIVENDMTPADRFQLIKYVTSVPRAPLLGFASLNPRFGIQNTGKANQERLPTAATCMNLLKLPDYRNRAVLKQKLMYAINAGAGFDLS